MKNVILLILFLFLSEFSFSQKKINENDLINLYNLMIGNFSNELQAKDDSSFKNVRMKIAPIWGEKDGYWLYIEQAYVSSENKPYRQRVYELKKNKDNSVECIVYFIKNSSKYIGEWKYENPLENLSLDSLDKRNGCSIIINKMAKSEFIGNTNNTDCENFINGASYATSTVNIYNDMIIIWDRGFDNNNNQVWGSEKGGIVFVKE